MLKIDSHQHFWVYNPVRDAWITDDMSVIQRDFLPGDLSPVYNEHEISGCVAVQADQSEAENGFLISQANSNNFIKGIVGWVNLKADNIEDRLQYYSTINIVKGFRHVLQAEPDDRYMLDRKFMQGIGLLDAYGFTYDILVKPNHLRYVKDFVVAFPNQCFVIDHIAKPYIKDKVIDGWREEISAIAAYPNVSCKISGMVTEANWTNWTVDDFTPYLDTVFNAFGASRVMFGSDWPVCNVAGEYKGVLNVAGSYVDKLSVNEQELFWAKNAIEFYGLSV
ncbi:amidohydrolase family protein [Inquilinus sp. KBS0705]|nr:amidohydrolase family protein [Inquilinus sp. KBS0705]